MGYTINEDGSVTRDRVPNSRNTSNSNNNRSGGNEDNNGCLWGVVIAIIIGIIAVVNSNRSTSNIVYEVADSTVCDTVEYYADTAATDYSCNNSYLSVSPSSVYFNSNGGSKEIFIETDGDWEISTSTANWGHLSKYSNSVTLTIDENTSSSSRSDYFEITAGSYSKRININQEGNTEPTAEINRIWMEHSIYVNNVKGMKIHVKFDVNNMEGEKVYGYAYFYYGDNETPLHDVYGNNLTFYGYGTSKYERSTFNDFTIFVPYTGLNMQPGTGSVELSFDIAITDAAGNQLARNNNTQITFSQ